MNREETAQCLLKGSQNVVRIPLKTEDKSNLNAYFGAGKVKGRFSRRDYYEVEIIISTKIPNRSLLPNKEDGNFTVITMMVINLNVLVKEIMEKISALLTI